MDTLDLEIHGDRSDDAVYLGYACRGSVNETFYLFLSLNEIFFAIILDSYPDYYETY